MNVAYKWTMFKQKYKTFLVFGHINIINTN